MKHYVDSPRYSTNESISRAASKPIDASFIGDTSMAVMGRLKKEHNTVANDQTQINVNDQTEINNRRTYGTAVDNRQYSAPPVGDYGLMGAPQAPQGDYHNWQNTDMGRNVRGVR